MTNTVVMNTLITEIVVLKKKKSYKEEPGLLQKIAYSQDWERNCSRWDQNIFSYEKQESYQRLLRSFQKNQESVKGIPTS